MKKIFLLSLYVGFGAATYAQTCYCYISAGADPKFEEYEGVYKKRIVTRVFRTPCDDSEISIKLEFKDAIKAEYPDTYAYVHHSVHVLKFETKSAAEKKRREIIGDYKADGWKVIPFLFVYYGDD